MKCIRIPFLCLAFCFILLTAACVAAPPPTSPPLATPKVPPLAEVDAAISRWKSGNNQSYLITVEETNSESKRLYRIVIANGEIRAAQQLDWQDSQWQPPISLELDVAQNYTVDALLSRVRNDVLGLGAAPMDMIIVFDSLSGFPSLVETQALPTYNEEGKLQMNRKASYTLSVKINVLIENTVAVNKTPLMVLSRSGGPQAFCDILRVFSDGSSVYSDDCRQTLLQITPPSHKLDLLAQLAAVHRGIDEMRELDGAQYHLIIHGTGTDAPPSDNLTQTWQIAEELAELLSHPIGAGVTLLFTKQGILAGFDMRTALSQPAALEIEQPLHNALVSPDGDYIGYADHKGARWLNGITGDTGTFFSNQNNSHYRLRAWNTQGTLILQRVSTENTVLEWGWTNLDAPTWHPLALKSDAFSCDTGISIHPTSNQIVFAAGGECQPDAGLTLVNLEDGGIRKLVDSDAVPEGGAFYPAWSPDGNWIAFSLSLMDTAENAHRLYIVHPDGTALTPLTKNMRGIASHPVWSTDGTRLYYALSNSEQGENGIYVYELATGTSKLFIATENGYPLSISLSDEFLAFWNGEGLSVYIVAFEQIFPVALNDEAGTLQFAGWLDLRTNK